MRCAIGMPIGVAIQTAHPAMGTFRTSIIRSIELLLWKRSHQQAQSFELLGIQYAIEQLKEIIERHQFSLRDISKVRPCRQKYWRGKLWKKVIGQIKIQVESG